MSSLVLFAMSEMNKGVKGDVNTRAFLLKIKLNFSSKHKLINTNDIRIKGALVYEPFKLKQKSFHLEKNQRLK